MSDTESSFMALALNGDILPDEIDDFIDEWHDGESRKELHDFLGMSLEEYTLWVSNPELISLIVGSRHSQIPILQAVNDNMLASDRIAARSDDTWKIAKLRQWVQQQLDNSRH